MPNCCYVNSKSIISEVSIRKKLLQGFILRYMTILHEDVYLHIFEKKCSGTKTNNMTALPEPFEHVLVNPPCILIARKKEKNGFTDLSYSIEDFTNIGKTKKHQEVMYHEESDLCSETEEDALNFLEEDEEEEEEEEEDNITETDM